MGQDKALLSWDSQYLVEKIAATVAAATGTVTLVGRPERYGHLNIPCIPDSRDGQGPLAGIEAALQSGQAEWNLIVSCDMPDISSAVLSFLLEKARETSASCVAAEDATGQIHPLCAVYHRRCLPIIRRSLESVGRALCGVSARADGFGKYQHAGRLALLAAFVTIKDEEYCQIWQAQPKVRII